ncbi:MAG: T9SS type A sorting domain-containing protein, partial [Flavobacteriales bacterium]
LHANFDLSTSKISLCNTFGKKIEISPNISGPTVTVAISHLSSGIYFLEVDTASEKYIFRIVKT